MDWPLALPPRVGPEIQRVLGQRVKSIAEQDGVFTLVLRQLPGVDPDGYYAALSREDIAQSLRLFDDRLQLVEHEVHGDQLTIMLVIEKGATGGDTETD